jgi:glycosyltransferase involved in cell wall biosynthesis
MFVFNDCRTDARVLREAATLHQAGHQVTILARPASSSSAVGDREVREGVEIIRVPVPARSRFRAAALRTPWHARKAWAEAIRTGLQALPTSAPRLAVLFGAALIFVPWLLLRGLFNLATRRARVRADVDWLIWWQIGVRGWAASAAAVAPAADVYHGHDLHGLEAAGRARRVHGGHLVYDSHEIFIESGSVATRPPLFKAILARSERRWMADASALVTVNRSLAAELGRRLAPRRTVVVHNAPATWDPPPIWPDLVRAATGIRADDPIALYHGGFSAHRGLEELAAAILVPGLERVQAVYLGYGSQRAMLDELAADSRYGGRIHVLDAVSPGELGPWVASADVGVIAIQASTLNHRLSTPNKLFEGLAAGLPVVVSNFPEMREIVLGDPLGPLGGVCRPDDPVDIARAISSILDAPPAERAALRGRCLAAAHARWNWEAEVDGLRRLYADLASAPAAAGSTGRDR